MENNQIKLLLELAKELKAKQKNQTKEDALKRLQAAGILNKKGDFSKNYPELRKFTNSKK
jgi:hypothetical protein